MQRLDFRLSETVEDNNFTAIANEVVILPRAPTGEETQTPPPPLDTSGLADPFAVLPPEIDIQTFVEPIPADGVRVMKDILVLYYDEAESDADMSTILRRERLAPAGIIRDIAMLQVRLPVGRDLLATRDDLSREPVLLGVDADPVLEMQDVAGEKFPPNLRDAYKRPVFDPRQAGGGFTGDLLSDNDEDNENVKKLSKKDAHGRNFQTYSALRQHWPHFKMQTFAAQRLVDKVLLRHYETPGNGQRRVILAVIDTGITPSASFLAEDRIFAATLLNGRRFDHTDVESRQVFTRVVVAGNRADVVQEIEDTTTQKLDDNDKVVSTLLGHGTGVASCALAFGGDLLGTGSGFGPINRDNGQPFPFTGPDRGIRFWPMRITHGPTDRPKFSPNRMALSSVVSAIREAVRIPLAGRLPTGARFRANVINISYGSKSTEIAKKTKQKKRLQEPGPLEKVLDMAAQRGTIVVVAAGNYGHLDHDEDKVPDVSMQVVLPGGLAPPGRRDLGDISKAGQQGHSPLVVTVGATGIGRRIVHLNDQDRPTKFTVADPRARNGFGRVSVAAPGGEVVVMGTNGNLLRTSGTSYAAPYVSGILAQMLWFDRHLRPPDPAGGLAAVRARSLRLIEMLESTADPIRGDRHGNKVGHGRVNYWKAVLAVANGGVASVQPDHFGSLPHLVEGSMVNRGLLKLDSDTPAWYGFEIRTPQPLAQVKLDDVVLTEAHNPSENLDFDPDALPPRPPDRPLGEVAHDVDAFKAVRPAETPMPLRVPLGEVLTEAEELEPGSKFSGLGLTVKQIAALRAANRVASWVTTFSIQRSDLIRGDGTMKRLTVGTGEFLYQLNLGRILTDDRDQADLQNRGVTFDDFVFTIDVAQAKTRKEE